MKYQDSEISLVTQMQNKPVEEGVSVQNSKSTRHFEAVPCRGMGAASRCGRLCVLGPAAGWGSAARQEFLSLSGEQLLWQMIVLNFRSFDN